MLKGYNDLETREPKIARQWYGSLNGSLRPDMVTAGSRKRVWWQCEEGHVWQAMVFSRTGPDKCGCPVCAGKVSRKRDERYARIVRANSAAA